MLAAYNVFFGKLGGASGGAGGGQPPKRPTENTLPADAIEVEVHRSFDELINEINRFPSGHSKHRQILKEIAKHADKYSEKQIHQFKVLLKERIGDRNIKQCADWKKLSDSHRSPNTWSGKNPHRVR